MARPKVKIEALHHRKQDCIALRFDYNRELIDKVKSIEGARWSATHSCWYFTKDDFNLNKVFETLKPLAYLDYSALSNKSTPPVIKEKKKIKPSVILPEAFVNLLDQKRYSDNTKKIYLSYFADFMRYFFDRDLTEISKKEINDYILYLIREKDISPSQQNQRINTIKFYYEKVLGREKEYYDIERPRRDKKLPDVISEKEVLNMLDKATNKKNELIISILYSSGIRRNELRNLRKNDIKYDKKMIVVKGGKGEKDRMTLLSDKTVELLTEYYDEYKPNYWVLEGPNRKQYSGTSICNIVKRTAKSANVSIKVTPHILRHTFATHLLEQGVDLRLIQKLLGHKQSTTTEIYTHVSNTSLARIKNPLDNLLKGKGGIINKIEEE